jgi:phenylpyruvate tautomerase PptA (4-oxalocrotonate tautomerase family)
MPSVSIDILREYSREQEIDIIDAVHRAMVDSLRIPAQNVTIRLVVHAPHRFTVPPGKSDRYALVSVDLFVGRSFEAKKLLFRSMVDNLGQLGIPSDHIKILLREASRENWGIRGGIPASEVELGYRVDI